VLLNDNLQRPTQTRTGGLVGLNGPGRKSSNHCTRHCLVQWLFNKFPSKHDATANNYAWNAQSADDISNSNAQVITDALEGRLRTRLTGFCSGYDIYKPQSASAPTVPALTSVQSGSTRKISGT
jgi:hypothetical protein